MATHDADVGSQNADAGSRSPLEGVAALLWGASAQVRRGPKPKLSVQKIADAGISIADQDGLSAVTMQHVADLLGTAKMALYRYVPGRTELEAVMLDRALGGPGGPGERVDGDGRAGLSRWALDLHERAAARPWSAELVQRPHLPGPNELAWFEAGLSAMRDMALEGGEKLDTLAMLVGHVMSIVRQQAAGPAPEDDLANALAPVLEQRAQEYPFTVAAFTQPGIQSESQSGTQLGTRSRTQSGRTARNDALLFGIERMIAGIEALAAERSSPRRGR